MNYYIADLHLGHSNVIGFDNRPFADVDEMTTEELTQYAVDNKYVDFSYRGRTDGMRYVTYDEVVNIGGDIFDCLRER